MNWRRLTPILAILACANGVHGPRSAKGISSKHIRPSASAVPAVSTAMHGAVPHPWTIRAFPQAELSIALPAQGTELSARDLGQVQASLAVGMQPDEHGPTYIVLVYPISSSQLRASVEQRLALLPYLLHDLGPEAARSPVALEGLPGVEFVTTKERTVQRSRVFVTPHRVIALLIKGTDPKQTTDGDATLFFESLQWYDEQR